MRTASQQGGMEGLALRIEARRRPDGSIEYAMGFDEVRETDLRLSPEGIDVVLSPPSKDLVEEMVLDFVELEPGEHQFIFMNPNDPHYVPPKKGS
ncbi:MAG: iron-sulfur cluster assembly accessory protein [Gammaproteobacteria bacterium]|nr:MAG: iron-sulfur cluster assembly accessory protein [Gammaproteobacteria bacterium]